MLYNRMTGGAEGFNKKMRAAPVGPPSDLVHGRGAMHNLSAAHERNLTQVELKCN